MGSLRVAASSVHVGRGSGRLSHTFNISLKHGSQMPCSFSLMASRVSGERESPTPRSYHFDLASQTASCTAQRSLMARQPVTMTTRDKEVNIKLTSYKVNRCSYMYSSSLTSRGWLCVQSNSRGGSLTILSVRGKDHIGSCCSS